jgi:hypothetical protein
LTRRIRWFILKAQGQLARKGLPLAKSANKQIQQVNIPLIIDKADILKRIKRLGNSTRNEKMAARLEQITGEIAEKALSVAKPKAIYRISRSRVIDRGTVEIDGVRFTSRSLSRCLENQPVVYPFLATAGRELDGMPSSPGDLMMQYTLDTIKMVILFSSLEYLTDYLKEKHSLRGTAALNPGEFADFPVTQQKPLFELFGDTAESLIGVTLTSGCALKPTKSRSGILFPNETGFLSCKLCTMVKCPGRRAAYDPAEVEKYITAD